jgi:protein phosphatase
VGKYRSPAPTNSKTLKRLTLGIEEIPKMLICPQCQFENPDTNKFCQQCGTSLTNKDCPECGTSVTYSAENCHNCGAFTGTLWWAIVFRPSSSAPGAESSPLMETKSNKSSKLPAPDLNQEKPINPVVTESPTPDQVQMLPQENLTGIDAVNSNALATANPPQASESEIVAYLDSQQRYQILEPMTPLLDSSIQVVKVLDRMPLQASPLEMLALQLQSTDTKEVMANTNVLEDSPIPDFALPYLELKEQFNSAIPAVHDAWMSNGTQVVLLEYRADWPHLIDLWRDDVIPQMQLLHILYDMTYLWEALEPFNCRQSLLLLTNLRADEDHTLVLQHLHPDPPDATLTLQSLGEIWQHLFRQTGRTLLGAMGQLMSDLETDRICSIDELRSRLDAIASELQDLTSVPPMLPVDPDANLEAETEEDMPVPPMTTPLYPPGEGEDAPDAPTVVLPMQLLSLEDAGCTDVGRSRRHNEDYFGIHTQINKLENLFGRTLQAKGLYILCDGMGGHAGGEVASALAVKTLLEYFQTQWQDQLPDEECIRKGVLHANQALFDLNQQDARSGSGRMGTTLVMVLIQDTQVAIAHVGDSRLYRMSRTSGLEQLTIDHEVGQREIIKGISPEIAYKRPDAYQLTQALGPRNAQFVIPDVQFFELDEDTLLLLCSDGLSDNDLIEKNWQTHLKPLISSRNNLDRGASDLIELANQYNGHDNITAVLIRAKVRPDLEQARFSNG